MCWWMWRRRGEGGGRGRRTGYDYDFVFVAAEFGVSRRGCAGDRGNAYGARYSPATLGI